MRIWIVVFMIMTVAGCDHKCPDCPEVIYKDRVIVKKVKEPIIVVVSDDVKLLLAYQIAKEALIAMSSSTTEYHSILCEDGNHRYWPTYSHWKLRQIEQALSESKEGGE